MSFFKCVWALVIVSFITACATDRPKNVSTFTKEGVIWGSQTDQQTCEQKRYSVWVTYKDVSECIKYYAGGLEAQNSIALFHIHGDVASAYYFKSRVSNVLKSYLRRTESSQQRFAETAALRYDIPFVYVARPGTFGSSGFHGDRYKEHNPGLINAAISAIKKKHNIKKISLSGQSGGGIGVAAILNWRNDVKCAVLASSVASLIDSIKAKYPASNISSREAIIYDPSRHINQMPNNPEREIFVLADKNDDVVKYDAQKSYARRLQAKGHRVKFITASARGTRNHDLANDAMKMSADCSKDERVAITDNKSKKIRDNTDQMTLFNKLWRREAHFNWPGRTSHEKIKMKYSSSSTTFFFTSKNVEVGYCIGIVYNEKNNSNLGWAITCDHKDQATGTVHFTHNNKVANAIATDEQGRKVELMFDPFNRALKN